MWQQQNEGSFGVNSSADVNSWNNSHRIWQQGLKAVVTWWHVVFVQAACHHVRVRCCWSQPSSLLIQLSEWCSVCFVSILPAMTLFQHLTPILSPPLYCLSSFLVSLPPDQLKTFNVSISASNLSSTVLSPQWFILSDIFCHSVLRVISCHSFCCQSRTPNDNVTSKILTVQNTKFSFATYVVPFFPIWFSHHSLENLSISSGPLQLSAQLILPELILQFRSYWGWHC